jgi:Zn-dependent protease
VIPGLPDSAEARQRNEAFEFLKAWVGTALAFAVLYRNLDELSFITILLITAFTAGLGVILHELAHRVVARYFGATAHFVANDAMLVLSVLIAFSGFLFAAPGAVWHSGWLTKRQSGLIAAAGPATNMVLALLFLGALAIVQNVTRSPVIIYGLFLGFSINGVLGLFNMLPFGPIDGAKILNWSAPVFGAMVAVAVLIAFGLPRLLGLPGIFG